MVKHSSRWIRIGFAGPGAIVVAVVMMAGMTQWLPQGSAGIDNLVVPLVLLPIIWAALFFHACLDRDLRRVAVIALGLLLVHGGLVAHKFMDRRVAPQEVRR
jgi:hypothetical protein